MEEFKRKIMKLIEEFIRMRMRIMEYSKNDMLGIGHRTYCEKIDHNIKVLKEAIFILKAENKNKS